MLLSLILTVYFIVCVVLILAILVQSNKGTSIAGVFGGGSDTFLGASNAVTWLNRVTTYLAVAYLTLSLVLMFLPGMMNTSRIVLPDTVEEPLEETQPAPQAPVTIPEQPAGGGEQSGEAVQ